MGKWCRDVVDMLQRAAGSPEKTPAMLGNR
jgi:hypothetical protein